LLTAEDISEFLQKCHFALRKPLFYPLNYGDAVNAKVRRRKEEVQRSRIRRMKEKSRGQISEIRRQRRINFDIRSA
jgi:hypothetical protein